MRRGIIYYTEEERKRKKRQPHPSDIVINDDTQSTDSVWSSLKTSKSIDEVQTKTDETIEAMDTKLTDFVDKTNEAIDEIKEEAAMKTITTIEFAEMISY